MYLGIVILRAPQGLDFSHVVEDEDVPTAPATEITHIQDTQNKGDKYLFNYSFFIIIINIYIYIFLYIYI